ncbi:hypothetical protein Lal_00025137 [Lupinus albus]|uniref:Uncharacterized protein n=1 Tax=Lupinus albus TaxID=3870 RepID=A0A6A5NY02_LUPAL|nr:hypothetical protein Lalb_Chr10g0102011 [Lupinus albus]KAF1889808.1 hypothetical protein Lal_00025137 [Lupinus albus]
MSSENHHFYHHSMHIYQRSIFLPMLCSRSSIKDVSLPNCRDPLWSFSNDPLSPRIGCTGQVKRHNKITALPISHRLRLTPKNNTTTTVVAATTLSPVVKYSKLKRLFSGKSIYINTVATVPTASRCESRPRVTVKNPDMPRNIHRCRNENFVPISIENMDPPLPVIKRVHKSEKGSKVDSVWKRRLGGAALKSLQVQKTHQTRHHL